jgi:CDP-paratose 2-epimerase
MKVLVTGSNGLIGSEAVEHFDRQGHEVLGVDNNMRRVFFGPAGDMLWNLDRLKSVTKRFTHAGLDIRDRTAIEELFRTRRFDLIVHSAAQPSHDKAREIPLLDFEVNALGTVNLLEATRQHSPEAVFVFLSSNKVYGDAPNEIPLRELESGTITHEQKILRAWTKAAGSIKHCIRCSALRKRRRILPRKSMGATLE